jgi:RNA polymerase sigma-70 factor, ECF subfamily
LTAAIRDKDAIRYEEMFRTYFSSLCYFARKYVGDLDSCKEIVHKVFVNIWEKRADFDFEKPAKSYLFTAVYNRCMNHIRDQKRAFANPSLELSEEISDKSLNINHMEAAELESQIWKVINGLPERCKEIFILNRFKGKKYQEIANHLDISVKTVETQMSKALKILRENLADYLHLFILLLIKKLW